MADWNKPTLPDLYSDFLTFLVNRDIDSATLFLADTTNTPTGAIRYNRSLNLLQEWNGTTWVTKVISQAGGGTGAGSLPALGTMASQNANAVAITGGTISGLNALSVNGQLNVAGPIAGANIIYGTNLYASGAFYAGASQRQITKSIDGSVWAGAIAPGSYSGSGTRVLIDNDTWVLANTVGGGVREVVHENFSFGTDEAVRTVVVPWAGPQPATIKCWHLQFDQPYADNSSENAGPMYYSVVYNTPNQATITRTRGPGAVGYLTPTQVHYTAFHHRVETQ